jgi:hypothetical protein
MAAILTLDAFVAEADAFLAERYPRRLTTEAKPFVWGEGSDEVRVFQEPDPANLVRVFVVLARYVATPCL